MTHSTHSKILEAIEDSRKGSLLFPGDFVETGNADAVRATFSRLAKDGTLRRLAHGIYLYPKEDALLGTLQPSLEEIAQAIAKRDKIRIMPAGVSALNKLGLSTQVPMKMVYLTDGKPKKIKIGKSLLTFKTAAPKKLAMKGKISSIVIQALEEMGQNVIKDEKTISRITELLLKEDKKILRQDAKLAPAWIARLIYSITEKMK
jgi:Family of unknown function (DUF6088)